MKRFINKRMLLMVLGLLAALAVACTPNGAGSSEALTMYVGAERADCVGVAPQRCLLVKFEPDANWEFHYDGIDGFTHELGFEHELRVQKIDVENPPADGSSFYYQLVEVVSKTAVSDTNISWEEAIDLLNSGQVAEAFQTHSLDVTLITADGRRFHTVEPAIDDIFAAIAECGDPCKDIIIATE